MTAHADLSPTLQLAIDLIRRPSVTPIDADCQKLMMQRLGDDKGREVLREHE